MPWRPQRAASGVRPHVAGARAGSGPSSGSRHLTLRCVQKTGALGNSEGYRCPRPRTVHVVLRCALQPSLEWRRAHPFRPVRDDPVAATTVPANQAPRVKTRERTRLIVRSPAGARGRTTTRGSGKLHACSLRFRARQLESPCTDDGLFITQQAPEQVVQASCSAHAVRSIRGRSLLGADLHSSISIAQTSFALEHATPSVSGSAGARSRSLVSADAEELLASLLGQHTRAAVMRAKRKARLVLGPLPSVSFDVRLREALERVRAEAESVLDHQVRVVHLTCSRLPARCARWPRDRAPCDSSPPSPASTWRASTGSTLAQGAARRRQARAARPDSDV